MKNDIYRALSFLVCKELKGGYKRLGDFFTYSECGERTSLTMGFLLQEMTKRGKYHSSWYYRASKL